MRQNKSLIRTSGGSSGWSRSCRNCKTAAWTTTAATWAGSTDPEQPHYYRIYAQDNFVIEYCTRDGGVDHIHGVFHDLSDPLAEDLLRRHFEQEHAGE